MKAISLPTDFDGRNPRTHFDNTLDVTYSIGSDFKLESISASIENILGYKPEEIIGRPFTELGIVAPESMPEASEDAKKLLSGDQLLGKTYEFIAKSGERCFGEVGGSPLLHDGTAIGFVSVARDITDRKEAEEERDRILNLSQDLICISATDGYFKYLNLAWERVVGYPLEELYLRLFFNS